MIPAIGRLSVPGSPAEAGLRAALQAEERAGIALMVRVRFFALAIIVAWLFVRISGAALYYYLVIVGLLALLGLAQAAAGRWTGWGGAVLRAALIFCDMGLLAFAFVVPNPTVIEGWPIAMQLRLGNFDFFYVFIAFAVLSYSPMIAFTTGCASVLAWSAGVIWVLDQANAFTVLSFRDIYTQGIEMVLELLLDPNYVSAVIWFQQVVLALLIAATLSVAVWRARRLVLRQASLAAERTSLARYFSPNMVEELAGAGGDLHAVRAQDVAVLFVDAVGFTALAERSTPEEIIELLRELHGRLARAVFDHGGTVDKYIGDGMMATFGTPNTGPHDATNALRCVRTIVDRMEAWNQERRASDRETVRVGVGLHFGPAVLGDIGDARRLEFAVIGDTVNTASRLEALTRQLGVGVVVSQELVDAARREGADLQLLLEGFQHQSPQRLRGREEAASVWTGGSLG